MPPRGSKRKAEPAQNTAKRGKLNSDDCADPPKLLEISMPQDREPGKLVIAGMVAWDFVGKKLDAKLKKLKTQPDLFVFHRFTDVKYRRVVSGPAAAHSVLITMDRKALTFGELKL